MLRETAVSIADEAAFPARDRVIARAGRFIQEARYRLYGPWRHELIDAGVAADLVDAAESELWVECLGSSEGATERIVATLDTVPRSCSELLFAVHAAGAGDAVRVAADAAAIANGLRRHPRLFDVVDYVEIETESGWLLLAYERLDDDTVRRFPAAVLAAERNLHMDMTREAGRRSDAHLVRYRFASERISPSARILDCACGLGYGSALMAREAPARSVTGVDLSQWVVDYATAAFCDARRFNLRYRQGDATDLAVFDDASFDAVVSFETIEHLLDPAPFLRHVRRVLADDGIFIGSVPYRWIFDGDTGDYHHDWFDAEKTLSLCGRFLSVESLWIQTAGGFGPPDRVRGLYRHQPLGEEPAGDVEWVLVAARKRPSVRQSSRSWLLLASSVSQVQTMAAALSEWGGDAAAVHVCGTAGCWDDVYDRAMADASQAFGFHYGGNLPIPKELAVFGESSSYQPGDDADVTAVAGHAARILDEFPVLDGLGGLNVVIPVRPDVLADYALLAALQPRQVHLIDGGVQPDVPYRDLPVASAFPGNPLARLPTDAEIVCPSWLLADTAIVGAARELPSSAMAAGHARLRAMPTARAFAADVADRPLPFTAIVISQAFCQDRLTSEDVSTTFVLHQVRALLARTSGSVLVKTHPRDGRRKVDALIRAFHDQRSRVRVMTADEAHLPIEAFHELAGGAALDVWGTSSAALLGCAAWAGVHVQAVDADYLEPEIRRRAWQFSRQHGVARSTLRADDGFLDQAEKLRLRRTFLPAPAVRREAEIATRLREAEDMRRAARARVEYALQRMDDARRWAVLGRQLLASPDERRIWIWGTGAGGRRLLEALRRLGVDPVGFLDSRPSEHARIVEGVQVHAADAPSAAAARAAGALVLIASMHAPEIQQRIHTDGHWGSTVLAWEQP